MAKQKKVTINHYLNKQLKPKEANGLLYYSPYTRVTFDRKNNKFPMDWARDFENGPVEPFYNRFTEEEFSNFLQKRPEYVRETDRMIEQSIRYEHHLFGDNFQLKGFGDRFELYRTTLYELFYEVVRESIIHGLETHLSRIELMKVRRALNKPAFSGNSLQIGEQDLKAYQEILPEELFQDITLCLMLSIYMVGTEYASRSIAVFDWVIKDMKSNFQNYVNSVLPDIGWQLSPNAIDKLDLFVNQALLEVY
jgi:hypothetical protein